MCLLGGSCREEEGTSCVSVCPEGRGCVRHGLGKAGKRRGKRRRMLGDTVRRYQEGKMRNTRGGRRVWWSEVCRTKQDSRKRKWLRRKRGVKILRHQM